MTFSLPSSPTYRAIGWQMVGNAQRFRSPITRKGQTVARRGSFWRCQLELPPIVDPIVAGAWAGAIARLIEGEACYVRPPSRKDVGAPGTPLVNGAGQTGSSLAVDGYNVGYVVRAGDMISFASGGITYLHIVTADATASGAGAATLSIKPELRVSPANNAAIIAPLCEMELETLEGDVFDLTDPITYGVSLSLVERIA